MYISVQSKTLQLTEALRQFAQQQVGRILRRRQRVSGVTIFLEKVAKKKNDLQAAIARIKISVPGREIVVERRSNNMYQAIHEVTARAALSLQKMKEKRLTAKRDQRWLESRIGYTA